MKNLTQLVLMTLLLGSSAFSQNWDTDVYKVGQKYPGYVVTNEGDTLQGWLQAQYPAGVLGSNQLSCKFYETDDQDKPVKYKAKEIQAYRIADKLYISMKYSGGISKTDKNFVLQTKDGAISEHIFYTAEWKLVPGRQPNESQTDFFNRIYQNKVVYNKADKIPADMQSLGMGFKKKMAAFVDDHEEMSKKIAGKEKGYRMLNLQKIIDEYNAWAASK